MKNLLEMIKITVFSPFGLIVSFLMPLFVSSQTTPLYRQKCIEKLLLLVYCVFLCDKTKKVVSLDKFDVLVELFVWTQTTAKKKATFVSLLRIFV